MEIIWSHQSLEDIELIGDYIAQDSPECACIFVDEIIESVESSASIYCDCSGSGANIVEINSSRRKLSY